MASFDSSLQLSWADLTELSTRKATYLQSREVTNCILVYIIEEGRVVAWTPVFKVSDERYDPVLWAQWIAVSETTNVPVIVKSEDGRVRTQPVTLGPNQWHSFHGVGDNPPAIYGGQKFNLSRSTVGDEVASWRYRDPVQLVGGEVYFSGAQLGDSVDLCVYAPASVAASTPGVGNANLVSGVFVPAIGGAWTVDLTQSSPVPSPTNTGFWDYTPSPTELGPGTITPGVPGASRWHLLPVRQTLVCFVKENPLLGARGFVDFEPPNVKATQLYPEWRLECTLHVTGVDHQVDLAWRVVSARKSTVS